MDRRLWLAHAAKLAALAAGASVPLAHARQGAANYPFSLGVASGSPLPDSVILWTRVLHDPLKAGATAPIAYPLQWEVAEDQAFTRLAARGKVAALPAAAHTVHVDVKGLLPGRWYFYRFMLGDAVSPTGRTRTAPASDAMPEHMKLAVASCQHWEFGAYAAHRHIAAAAPDLVAFLGDYIYEWGPYRLEHVDKALREDECYSLADYRARYAQYKSDADLQSSHHAAPWIMTWDDHEVANDYANDRDEVLDVHMLARRAAAYQAWYEHMPLRLTLPPRHNFAFTRIHQRYDWGRLARFHVLDDRQYRAYQACPRPNRGGSNSVTRKDCAALLDPRRSMLGPEQEAWLSTGLRTSNARWNILAQQTLMAQSSQLPFESALDGRFWTDGWDGYPAARQRLLQTLQASGASNPLVLSGDVHSFYAAELRSDFDRPQSTNNPVVASEFCGTSVTSSSRPQARTAQYLEMNPHIKYGRSDKRGFLLLDVTPSKTTAFCMGLDNVHDAASNLAPLAAFQVLDGQPGVLTQGV